MPTAPQCTDLGVRGVRFNLVSPTGNHADIRSNFLALAPRLQVLGWHVQWYARPDEIPTIAALHHHTTVPAVLGQISARKITRTISTWTILPGRRCARWRGLGAWVKLSGWYRLQATAPYSPLDGHLQRVAGLFAERLVWGSDWPHTAFDPQALPSYSGHA